VNRKEITFVSFASRTSRSDTNFIRRSARDTLPGSDNLGEHRVSISVSWSGLYRYLHVYTMWINTDCLKYCVCSLYQLDFWGIGMNSMNSDLRTNWFQWVDPTFGWQWVNIGNLPALLLTVKGKVKITLEQATKARGGGEWRCSSTLSLTSALDGGEWSTPRPGRFTPGKTRYPLYRRLGGPQGRSGQVRKISLSPGFDPRIVLPLASRYTDWAVAALCFADIIFSKCLLLTTLFWP